MRKNGWTDAENDILDRAVAAAGTEHGTLTEAFRRTAAQTGRMPNSVRNHYYAVMRTGLGPGSRYVPFSEQDARELAGLMLSLISKGYSVRRAALELADGDVKRMLRYQNKFRSLCERRPELIDSLAEGCGAGFSANKRKKSRRETELAAVIASKNRELEEQRERFMKLHAAFTRLCELNPELTEKLEERSV